MPTLPEARLLLAERFGFPDFREGQAGVVERLLAGKSVLAVFPTGAGKSVCYQLPALMFDGITLVVSPLIALMKDQIDFLRGKGINAARLDSTVEPAEARQAFSDLRAGTLKLLYIAPERLGNERFLASIAKQKISMLAVDEAHCISEWGHNFRPDYLKVARLAKQLKVERVLGLTATAPPAVASQIAKAFSIDEADVIRTGFHRPNLSLRAMPTAPRERDGLLLARLRERAAGPTVVYVTLQKTAEHVAAMLAHGGLPARPYHAGLKAEERAEIQDEFMASDRAIVVATIAFGMGIDKRDIRYVYHYNLPKSLENYAQEVGRAGRDGAASTCEMLVCVEDRVPLENFTFGDTPTREAIAALVGEINDQHAQFDVSVYDLSNRFDIRQLVVETLLTYLQLANVIESVGAFYDEYKFQWKRPIGEVLGEFDADRQAFLKRLFAQGRMGKTWTSIILNDAAATLNEPRDRLVAALNYLAERGAVDLEVTGVRQAFRKKSTPSPEQLQTLIDKLDARFVEREMRDVDRLDSVMELADADECIAARLARYFGDAGSKPCGHCSVCLGEHQPLRPPAPQREFDERDADHVAGLMEMRSPALSAPRQIACFLCGINSPATSRARLGKHELFGAWNDRSFSDVLEFVETVVDQAHA